MHASPSQPCSGSVTPALLNSAKAKKHYLILSFDRGAAHKEGVVEAAAMRDSQVRQHVLVRRGFKPRNGSSTRKKRKEIEERMFVWILNTQQVDDPPNSRLNNKIIFSFHVRPRKRFRSVVIDPNSSAARASRDRSQLFGRSRKFELIISPKHARNDVQEIVSV
jgi:hypothetical protein